MAEAEDRDFPAIGVIEVRGLVDAATVVDAIFKAADVELLRSLRVGSGWVAAWYGGDLDPVNTATDAAYVALGDDRDARSCIFTLPSEAIRRFMDSPVSA